MIPKNGHLVIGSALQSETTKMKYDLFKAKLAEKFGVNGEVLRKEAHLIFRPSSINDIFLGTGNLMLFGEAAGLVSPSTGEGISFALRSGHYCANPH